MTATTETRAESLRSNLGEKSEEVHREYLAQDESPEALALKKREDALRRKLDCYVAPVMMMLMLISYLDRGNIGFAATQGMTKDIGLKGSELNVSVISLLLDNILMLRRRPFRYSTSFTSLLKWVAQPKTVSCTTNPYCSSQPPFW
jgi:hypothetical protein